MPWEKAQLVELREDVSPGFSPGNLCRDGKGRIGFGSGRYVQLTAEKLKPFPSAQAPLIRARDQVSAFTFLMSERSSPELYIATETSPPAIEVYREEKDGSYKHVAEKMLDKSYTDTVITAMTMASAARSPLLVIGLSTGELLFFLNERDKLERVCSILALTAAVSCLSGDLSCHRGLLAAADERGNVKAWRERASTVWDEIYSLSLENDYATALAIRGPYLFVGHYIGLFVVHDLDDRRMITDVVTNTRSITAIDAHPSQPMVVVAGEDCRASILVLPSAGEAQLKLVFSVCVNGAITGAVFTCARQHQPDISLAIYERSYIVQYNSIAPA